VRHADACSVSVGWRAPLVPITDPPSTPRVGTSCEIPQQLKTLVSALSPMRVPPIRMRGGPHGAERIALIGAAPAARYHCSIRSWMKALIRRSLSRLGRHAQLERATPVGNSRHLEIVW